MRRVCPDGTRTASGRAALSTLEPIVIGLIEQADSKAAAARVAKDGFMKRSWCGRDDGKRAPRAADRRRYEGTTRSDAIGLRSAKKKPARGRLSSRRWRPTWPGSPS